MRWLLLKDLQILRRSPLQAVLLIAYPILIAVLVGFAISRSPEKPRVALLNEVPASSRVTVGESELPKIGVEDRICKQVECVRVEDRAEALDEVRSGDVLAALVLPADLVDRINSLSTPVPRTPEVEVILNEEDPVKARFVNDRISSLLARANLAIAGRLAKEGGRFVGLIVRGGELQVLGQSVPILGLRNANRILRSLRPALRPGPLRDSLDQVLEFTALTRGNLGEASILLTRLTQPIAVDRQVVNASTPPLEIFAIAVAAAFTLAFVVVLLVAGSLALEREENAYPRLTRGLLSPSSLLVAKVVLGVAVGLLVTLLMLAGLSPFVPLHWDRLGLWLVAIVAGGAALGAAGAALGAAARDVRAVSLLAFMVTLPIAFLSLVPSGTVGPLLNDAIRVLTALFPFKPALQAITGALDPGGASIATAVAHLAVLTAAYGVLARFALRRFAAA
ncbi:MAG TPA: ABC transporter permease [Solirubrobacterales bacterium]|nr:ABC transporter permease [Solirubrobacterales bacterium]